jgi:hypothetical protein
VGVAGQFGPERRAAAEAYDDPVHEVHHAEGESGGAHGRDDRPECGLHGKSLSDGSDSKVS